jgi:hypothetical protein
VGVGLVIISSYSEWLIAVNGPHPWCKVVDMRLGNTETDAYQP